MITASTEKAACSLTRCSSMRNQREDEEANMYFVTCLFSPGYVLGIFTALDIYNENHNFDLFRFI